MHGLMSIETQECVQTWAFWGYLGYLKPIYSLLEPKFTQKLVSTHGISIISMIGGLGKLDLHIYAWLDVH